MCRSPEALARGPRGHFMPASLSLPSRRLPFACARGGSRAGWSGPRPERSPRSSALFRLCKPETARRALVQCALAVPSGIQECRAPVENRLQSCFLKFNCAKLLTGTTLRPSSPGGLLAQLRSYLLSPCSHGGLRSATCEHGLPFLLSKLLLLGIRRQVFQLQWFVLGARSALIA
jgi:hypothetical protein